jgi:hypothetical protein
LNLRSELKIPFEFLNVETPLFQVLRGGRVVPLKRGYLLKRSSNLRGDWKRRYWVLDARGLLYYYRDMTGTSSDFAAVRTPTSQQRTLVRKKPTALISILKTSIKALHPLNRLMAGFVEWYIGSRKSPYNSSSTCVLLLTCTPNRADGKQLRCRF